MAVISAILPLGHLLDYSLSSPSIPVFIFIFILAPYIHHVHTILF